MTTQSHFDTALFAFLEALRSNNNREWFQAHRQGYERDVRGPMPRFIGDVGPHLWQLSPRFVADARPQWPLAVWSCTFSLLVIPVS